MVFRNGATHYTNANGRGGIAVVNRDIPGFDRYCLNEFQIWCCLTSICSEKLIDALITILGAKTLKKLQFQ